MAISSKQARTDAGSREDEADPTSSGQRPRRRRIRRDSRARRRRAETMEAALPLSGRAISCLVQRLPKRKGKAESDLPGEMPSFGGQPSPKKMLRIAAGCTRSELLAIRGVGVGTVDEIGTWLEAHGHGFRPEPDGATIALRRAIEHLQALVEMGSEQAHLDAFLELPHLKKALQAAIQQDNGSGKRA